MRQHFTWGASLNLNKWESKMLRELKEQGLKAGKHRATVELTLSCDSSVYAVEDERFLYYAQNIKENDSSIKVFHIVKGKFDYSMNLDDWDEFIKLMQSVDDDFFVSGEGQEFKECFLGKYLSKYNRRKEFITDLANVIDDAKMWFAY